MKTFSKVVVATAVLASLLEIIDTSIVNVAIPRMQGNLGVTLDQITWVSTGYIISNAIVLPIAGWLGIHFGRKPYFTTCILIFTLSSILCAISPSFLFLVAARVIQGAAGGALLPTAQAIIQEQFPGERAGIGSAIYGVSVMVGPAAGPTLGGYLTDNFNWRWIFYINIPIGIVAAILSYLFVTDPEEDMKTDVKAARGKVDMMGFALLAIGLGSLQFLLERGQADNWLDSNYILVAAVLAAIGLPIFFAWEYNHKDPIVDVKLFKNSAVSGGALMMAATGLILYSVIFILPTYTEVIVGMDTTHTGLLYIPGSLATMIAMAFSGKTLSRLGPKPLIMIGITLVSISLLQMSQFSTRSGAPNIYWPLIIRGIALGFIFVPINAMVLSQFKGKQIGQAAGLLNLSRQIGGSIGIAGMSTYLDRFSSQIRNDLRGHISLLSQSTQEAMARSTGSGGKFLSNQIGMNQSTVGMGNSTLAFVKQFSGRLETQVFQLSFDRLMMCILVVYALSIIPLWRIQLTKPVKGPVSGE